MDIDTIKVFASNYIMEQDNIPIKNKCNLVNFVKEADGDEILHRIFNGSVPDHTLDGAERFVLRSQAEYHIAPLITSFLAEAPGSMGGSFYFDGGKLIATGKEYGKKGLEKGKEVLKKAAKYKPAAIGVGSAAIVAAGAAVAYQAYKKYMSQAAKNCKGRTGMEKRNCMVAFQKKALQAKAATLQKMKGQCSKSKSPGKCNAKYDAKIKKVRYKIATLHSKY